MNKQEIESAIAILTGNATGFKDLLTEQPEHPMRGHIKRQIDCLYMAISAITQQLTNRWIPVTERLPEVSNSYQVTKICNGEDNSIYDTCTEVFWKNDNKWDCERDELCEWKVIAWKEKEEPYKE
jgi:hypothetical protein